MQRYVEIPLTPNAIDYLGKDQAIADLTFRAWYIALKDCRPAQSLRLVSTEIRQGNMFGDLVQRYRFLFEAD